MHIWPSGIVESVTSAPVVRQVVPNIGENNKVNFTVTTFSVVEVGTLFVSEYHMSCLHKFQLFFVSPSWQLKWFSDFEELQLKLWQDTAHSLHALPSIPPTTVKGIVSSLSYGLIDSWSLSYQ